MVDIAWGNRVSPAFKQKVIQISQQLACDPNNLMAAMAFETGETFSPSIRNPASGATGLIQFMATTAHALGTSTDALAVMSADTQLDYVYAYMQRFTGRLNSVEDVYMAILWPVAVGKPMDYVLFAEGGAAYAQNKGLDTNQDGTVTKAEAAGRARAKLVRGLQPGFIG